MDPRITKKKKIFPINAPLRSYLEEFNRVVAFKVQYEDLRHFRDSFPLLDSEGKDTLWETVQYASSDTKEIYPELTKIYAHLRTQGDMSLLQHLRVDRVDYCTFGNTKPFRVRIINNFNDNYDYFYMKVADASRVYGLELEHVLSPNRIEFLIYGNTLVEEHIAGVPGDVFVEKYFNRPDFNGVRFAKEFVKFNERCFTRLLGDMRAYNFVIDITPDFDNIQYRIRAIDFDQQSYEGKRSVYQPSFFKENKPYVALCHKYLNEVTFKQYQQEERALIATRVLTSQRRLKLLEAAAINDTMSSPEKVNQLKEQLTKHYDEPKFLECNSMGEITKMSLRVLLTTNQDLVKKQYQ